jgi:hypothetical protein
VRSNHTVTSSVGRSSLVSPPRSVCLATMCRRRPHRLPRRSVGRVTCPAPRPCCRAVGVSSHRPMGRARRGSGPLTRPRPPRACAGRDASAFYRGRKSLHRAESVRVGKPPIREPTQFIKIQQSLVHGADTPSPGREVVLTLPAYLTAQASDRYLEQVGRGRSFASADHERPYALTPSLPACRRSWLLETWFANLTDPCVGPMRLCRSPLVILEEATSHPVVVVSGRRPAGSPANLPDA